MAAAGAVVFDGSVVKSLGFSLGSAAVVWLTGLVLVWLLGLVWAAEAGREAEADLVLAQERLRVSRELHDVLGHRLGIIALKAELAADLAATDPARSAAESGEIREIAAATLAEARRAVHGETVADLAARIASADLVLGSAGIETTIDVDPDPAQLSVSASRLLAAVVREAVTNILRHSDARKVSITFDGTEPCPTLVIMNDGAGRPNGGTARDVPPHPEPVWLPWRRVVRPPGDDWSLARPTTAGSSYGWSCQRAAADCNDRPVNPGADRR